MWHRCKTVDDCKKLFRRLALMIHPDKGGEADIFITIQESYEMELINRKSKEYKPPTYQPQERLYEQRYDKVHEGDPDLNILSEIEEYASTHPKFNCDYLHAMIDPTRDKPRPLGRGRIALAFNSIFSIQSLLSKDLRLDKPKVTLLRYEHIRPLWG